MGSTGFAIIATIAQFQLRTVPACYTPRPENAKTRPVQDRITVLGLHGVARPSAARLECARKGMAENALRRHYEQPDKPRPNK
jgi:hypothetical protein